MEKTAPSSRLLKSILAATLAATMCLPVAALSPRTALADEAGTQALNAPMEAGDSESDPILISSADDLKQIAANVNDGTTTYAGKYLKLENDITLDSTYTPIGNTNKKLFAGTFDGAGHTITFDNYVSTSKYAGLFGFIGSGAVVSNLIVAGSITNSQASSDTGSVADRAIGDATLKNVGSTAVISMSQAKTSTSSFGGLIGNVSGVAGVKTSILGCYFRGEFTFDEATVLTSSAIGGLVGKLVQPANVDIRSSYSGATFPADVYYAGGAIGQTAYNTTSSLTSVYSSSTIASTKAFFGALIGGGKSGYGTRSFSNCVVYANNIPSQSGDTAGTFPDGVTYFDPATSIASSVAALNAGVSDASLQYASTLDAAIAGGYPYLSWEVGGSDTPVAPQSATITYDIEKVIVTSPYTQTYYGGAVKLANAPAGTPGAVSAGETVSGTPAEADITGAVAETNQYWKFVGWKLGDEIVSTSEALSADMVRANLSKGADGLCADTTFTACYEMIEYTLTYHPNYEGATADVVVKTATPAKRGDTFAATTTFTREGYAFNSWNTEPDGSGKRCSGTVLNAMDIFGEGTAVDLYAQWKDAVRSYSIIVTPSNAQVKPTVSVVNDETGEAVEVTSNNANNNTQIFRAANLLCKQSYTVTVSADGYRTHVETIPADLTDTGKSINVALSPASSCTISFDANSDEASGSMDSQRVEIGEEFALASCGFTAPVHYEFAGWNTQADGEGMSYAAGEAITLPEDSESELALYAQWEKTPCVWADDFTTDVPATCTNVGSKSKHCTIDGCTEVTEVTELPALGHAWDEGVVTIEPTYTSPGTKVLTCTREGCGEIKLESIPALENPVIETINNPDGSVTTITTDYVAETVTTKVRLVSGVTITTVIPFNESAGWTNIVIPDDATGVVVLPAGVLSDKNYNSAMISGPAGTQVFVPWEDVTSGTVVLSLDSPGAVEVIRKSAPVDDGIAFILPEGGAHIGISTDHVSYPDVAGDEWFAKNGVIEFLAARSLITGVVQPDGTAEFQGDSPMTRGMFATVLNRLEDGVAATEPLSFTDVEADEWYTNGIAWAAQCGIVTGYSGTTMFGPNDNITREQLVTIMMRYADYLGVDTSSRADLSNFSDAGDLSFGEDAMSWAVAEGLVHGYDDSNELGVMANATRAEVGTIFMRFVTYLVTA